MKRDIKLIYTAPDPDAALIAMDEHDEKWDKKYAAVIRLNKVVVLPWALSSRAALSGKGPHVRRRCPGRESYQPIGSAIRTGNRWARCLLSW